MSWHLARMTVFDLESTAPDPEEARIVSACLGSVGGAVATQVEQVIVNPGVEIPQGAIDVHGITNERAQAVGADPAETVQWLATLLTGAWAAGQPVVAYNAAYDLTLLDREMRRHLGFGLEITGPVVDPFVIDREIDKFRKGKRTLSVTAEHYAVALNGAHDATEDALCAGRIAWRIGQRFPKIAGMSLGQLHEAQIGWHAARQDDFRAYLVRSGKPTDGVCGDWPLRPALAGAVA